MSTFYFFLLTNLDFPNLQLNTSFGYFWRHDLITFINSQPSVLWFWKAIKWNIIFKLRKENCIKFKTLNLTGAMIWFRYKSWYYKYIKKVMPFKVLQNLPCVDWLPMLEISHSLVEALFFCCQLVSFPLSKTISNKRWRFRNVSSFVVCNSAYNFFILVLWICEGHLILVSIDSSLL